MISPAGEYGLRAMVAIGETDGEALVTARFVEQTQLPRGYLPEVLQTLRHAGLVGKRRRHLLACVRIPAGCLQNRGPVAYTKRNHGPDREGSDQPTCVRENKKPREETQNGTPDRPRGEQC